MHSDTHWISARTWAWEQPMRIALGVAMALCLAGCGHAEAPATAMRLTSSAIGADGRIDPRQSAYGANLSPALFWEPAAGARAYALILEDPDAPGAPHFTHWLIWNIPGGTTSLPQGLPIGPGLTAPPGARQGLNDAGDAGYFGPKPPSGVHHYHFLIFALDAPLTLGPEARRDTLVGAMRGHVLAKGELIGTYAAP